MRVAVVIYGGLDQVSGGYLYDRKLVEYLKRMGDQVDLISLTRRNYALHLLDNASPSLYELLSSLSVDVLIQDELNHPSLFLINPRLRTKVRFPIVSIVHHLRSYEQHPIWFNVLYRWVERKYLASLDGFISNSEATRQAVVQILGCRKLPNSIVAYPAGNRLSRQITREQIVARAQESRSLRVLFVGNLIPRKGLHALLNALALLPRDTWQLTVVGNENIDKSYVRSVHNQIASHRLTNVRFVGKVLDDDLANTFAQNDVLAVPSQYEGFGIVYLEGMGFGLPAIASARGGACEIVTNGKDGFLIEPDDFATLALRLDALRRDRALLLRASLAAHHRFQAHPRWEDSEVKIRSKLIELIQNNA